MPNPEVQTKSVDPKSAESTKEGSRNVKQSLIMASLRRKIGNAYKEIQVISEQRRKVNVPNPSETDVLMFQGMAKSLETHYSTFNALWDDLSDLSEEINGDFPNPSETGQKTEVRNLYYKALATYEGYRKVESRTTSSQSINPSSYSVVNEARTRSLPKIQLPSFDGQLLNWTQFRDTYTSLVHEDPLLSNMDKFHYLRTCLKGSALSSIAHLALEEQNYNIAWKAVMSTFDNRRLLAAAYLDNLINFKQIKGNTASMKTFLSVVSDTVAAFKLLKIPDEADFILFHLSVRCLDNTTRELFEMSQGDVTFPTFEALSKFARERTMALELTAQSNVLIPTASPSVKIPYAPAHKFTSHSRPRTSFRTSLLSQSTHNKTAKSNCPNPTIKVADKCYVCKHGVHPILSCEKYHNASPQERKGLLKGWNGCFNCLGNSHNVQSCKSVWRCRFCPTRHHSTLHVFSPSNNVSQGPSSSSNLTEESVYNICAVSNNQEHVILGTALALARDSRGQYQTIRMVLDSGSQNSYVTQQCISRLGLQVDPMTRKIRGIGQTIFDGAKGKTCCSIKPIHNDNCMSTEAIVLSTITSYLPSSPISTEIIKEFQDHQLADPHFWKPGPIDFLLGADLFPYIWTGAVSHPNYSGPALFSTIFGLVVMGRISEYSHIQTTSLLLTEGSCDLNAQLERFWRLEEPATFHPKLDVLDQMCEDHFTSTHYRTAEGRYVVRLPFKEQPPEMTNTFPVALRRFYNMERRLGKDTSMRDKYNEFMTEYLSMNHMELASTPSRYIIPHHCIWKEANESSKFRVVFDASLNAGSGSLNEHLLIGPKLHNDVSQVILRFRRHKIAFTTDIVKMFRMINVDPIDRKFLHIYWRFSQADPVRRYELKTVTYGLACAPFLANRVLRQLVADDGASYPQASTATLHDLYVDDILTGAASISEAIALQEQLVKLFGGAGFQLSKWHSNCKELLYNVHENTLKPLDVSPHEEYAVKILGLQWDPTTDCFSFTIGQPSINITKRGILSTVARIYDPLGFLTPTTLMMKGFIQELWVHKLDWDQPLPNFLVESWLKLTEELPLLSKIQIPRFVGLDDALSCQLIGFSDASAKGYAAVLYLRVASPSGFKNSLLIAKSKLAPTKSQSIPRLELCGALLLAELYQAVLAEMDSFEMQVEAPTFFTDSQIVLAWLNTCPNRLKVFVANRVAKIQELTSPIRWRHVISAENPSDPASRGILPSQLITDELWWYGPPWLTKCEVDWPSHTIESPATLPEAKEDLHSLLANPTQNPLISWMERSSSFYSLLRSAGWLRRFINNGCPSKGRIRQGPLQKAEFDEGLLMCISAVQSHYFAGEGIEERFANLMPFKDPNHIWRVGGRLRNSSLEESQRHPILLPYEAHFTSILVDYFHKIYHHPGPSTLQAILQKKYWVPSIRRLIRNRGFHCMRCFKSRATPVVPIMGDLPSYRVNGGRSFLHVGVDFAGPFLMKESSRRKAALGKVYLCLYVCMATKALHLEAVTRLTTDAFLASFERFTARRGLPSDIYSDCGSNFLGAARHLKELYQWLISSETKHDLLDYAMKFNVRWHFNPPQTPHMGGIWEAGVKSVKRYLRIIAGETPMTFEEITTWFSKIEAMLNSRPLCPISTSPSELDYLSPGHFLIGGPLVMTPEPSTLDIAENRLDRWQLIQKMSQQFWTRWRSEYLTTLQRRPKWFHQRKNLEINDLVLLTDNVPPLLWKTARVCAVHPGKDGVVRVVTVTTGKNTFKRPVVRLAPLLPLAVPPYNQGS